MSFPASIPTTNPQNITLQGPVGLVQASRNPNSNDSAYTPGVTEWQNTTSGNCFKLATTGINGAVWQRITSTNGAILDFLPDTGTSPVVPDIDGNVTLAGSGSTQTVGGTNTVTFQLTGLTTHNVLVGAGTSTITKVPPSATSGVPLISQGSSADPVFGTAVVAGGGTGDTSFTAYAVICGGTTSTGNLQNVSGVGSAGQVLTSNGAGSLPTWQAGGVFDLSITTVNHAASPYAVLSTDQFLAVDTTGGTVTIDCPNTTGTGRTLYIKDSKGDAFTNNISVTTPGGTVTFDGSTTYTMNVNYQSINLIFDGTNYEVF